MAVSSKVTESPEATMARVKSELEAAGTKTGATRQASVEKNAGITATAPPSGATPISGPSGLQGLTEDQIWRDPNSSKIYKQPLTAGGAFVDLVRQKTQEKITAKRDELLSAPENYDTQVALQRGKLYEALSEEATSLTSEDLRWLSPEQQSAIRSGDKGLIKNAIIGLNSILQFRSDARKEEEAKAEKEEAKRLAQAETTFNVYSQNGLWSSLSPEARASMEVTLGMPTGTIDSLAANQNTDTNEYKYSSGLGNSIVETVTDKKTGKLVSTRTIGSTASGSSSGGGGSAADESTTPADVISKDDFTSAYISEVGELSAMSPDITNPEVKAQIDALYQEYVGSIPTTSSVSDAKLIKSLSSTDKKKMYARGLDPASGSDVKKYLEEEYNKTETEKISSEESDNPFE